MIKAALIEIDGSHDECLYSQLLFLKKGKYHTTLICSQDLEKQVAEFDTADEKIFFTFKGRSAAGKWKELWKLRNYIVKNRISKVILNSTHGTLIRNFTLLPFPASVKFYGTLHGINKLKGSLTQRIIGRKVKNYFLLNDYLKDNLQLVPHKGFRFQAYYPIFFPVFKNEPVIDKPGNELWVCIPGQVEYKRRDYETLVRAFASLDKKPSLKFILLGRSDHKDGNGKELKDLVRQLGVEAHFIFREGFIENGDFHAHLKRSDIIMPLVHPGNDGFEKYLHYQITGGYNLAFAYKKPLLMLKDFECYEDFKENALFYSLENLSSVLQDLPQLIDKITSQLYQDPKWEFEEQSARYLSFIQ